MIIDEAKSLSYFVGTYIRDNKYPDMRGSIFLVFKRNNTKVCLFNEEKPTIYNKNKEEIVFKKNVFKLYFFCCS